MRLQEAADRFRSKGLLVRATGPDYLMIATGTSVAGDGIQLFENASALVGKGDDQYVALLPSAGHIPVDVPGTLDELVPLVEKVYARFRDSSQPLCEAVREIVLKAPDWSPHQVATKT